MNYTPHRPAPLLTPYVKCYWFLEGVLPTDALQPERIFPDGCMELIIHYGEAFQKFTRHKIEKQSNAFVFGQLEEYIELVPSAIIGVMGVKFFPNGLAHFTSLPVHMLKEQEVELSQIFKGDNGQLINEIGEAKNNAQRAGLMDRFLLNHLIPEKRNTLLANAMLRDVYQNKGCISVGELVNKYHITERQAERVFAQEIGLSPKNFGRIIRFQQVFKLAGSANSLTGLALDAGYYDQAHFSREFKCFTGLSPRQYFNGRYKFAGIFLDD